MSLLPLSVRVGNKFHTLVAAVGLSRQGSHQVCATKLERDLDLVIGALGRIQLVTLAHAVHVAVRNRPVETDPCIDDRLQEL